MAIATCNIKVNGQWVRAGEHYEPETTQMQIPVEPAKAEPEPEAVKEETPKAAPKARSTSRRTTKK